MIGIQARCIACNRRRIVYLGRGCRECAESGEAVYPTLDGGSSHGESEVHHVAVWHTPRDLGHLTEWSVSAVRRDGTEIESVGGSNYRREAHRMGKRTAKWMCVPVHLASPASTGDAERS